jgi:16S rRNA (guanine1207-N2)-methyltransferase
MMRNERLSLPFDQGLIEAVGDAPVVAIRANRATVYEQFDTLVYVQGFKPVYDTLKQQGLPVVMVIVELTRSKAETLANIATGYGILEPGGTLVVDGMKTDGIESILKAVKKLLPVEGTLSKAHGKVFWLTKTDTPPEFAYWAKALTPARNAEGYFTAAGMFSPDAADAGSALLAGKIGDRLKGKGADLGAGWGTRPKTPHWPAPAGTSPIRAPNSTGPTSAP